MFRTDVGRRCNEETAIAKYFVSETSERFCSAMQILALVYVPANYIVTIERIVTWARQMVRKIRSPRVSGTPSVSLGLRNLALPIGRIVGIPFESRVLLDTIVALLQPHN